MRIAPPSPGMHVVCSDSRPPSTPPLTAGWLKFGTITTLSAHKQCETLASAPQNFVQWPAERAPSFANRTLRRDMGFTPPAPCYPHVSHQTSCAGTASRSSRGDVRYRGWWRTPASASTGSHAPGVGPRDDVSRSAMSCNGVLPSCDSRFNRSNACTASMSNRSINMPLACPITSREASALWNC
jgi:hypothetical protein